VWRVLSFPSGRNPPFFLLLNDPSITKPFKKETFGEKNHLISREFLHQIRGRHFLIVAEIPPSIEAS